MTTAIAKASPGGGNVERVLVGGDLSKLSEQERIAYYAQVCESVGLNPLTKPFDYIVLNGKLVLYAKRDATDQLRRRDKVSVTITSREIEKDLCVVTARATTPDGRTDESVGAVDIAGLKGEKLANAYMKAETKAKRRVTLSICGLGWLDETEVESVHAPEVKPAAAAAAPAKAPAAARLPRDGVELFGRLKDYEAKLVKQGLCADRALTQYVEMRGDAEGYGSLIQDWNADAIADAAGWVKEFEATRTKQPQTAGVS
jgi:hypothetical protein